jgi:hypothetical protein
MSGLKFFSKAFRRVISLFPYRRWPIDGILNLNGVIGHVDKLMSELNGTFKSFQL